jgi:ABC-2 type transport system permease protein
MVIYILWLRQLKRYLRSKSRIIGSIGQPMLFLIAFGFGFGAIYKKAEGGNYIDFLAPGIMAQGILFTSVFSGIEMIWDRQFGFLKETLAAPVSRLEIMIGRTLGGATIATIQGLLIFLLTLAVGFRPHNWLLMPVVILIMFLCALFFTALGTAIASTMDDFHGFQLVMNFLVMPLFFLSGALFPLNGVPKFITVLATINPLTYCVAALRATLLSISMGIVVSNILILCLACIVIMIIGAYLFSKIQL